MRSMLRRMTLRRKIWLSFIAMLFLAVAATGFFSYRIAVGIVEAKVLEQSGDSLNKTAQATDESLKRMMVSVLSMLLSEPMKQMVKDVSVGKGDNYVLHLSALQSIFSQTRMNESLIHSILVVTPIGEFYPLTNARSGVRFEDTPLYGLVSETGRPTWVEAHEDELFTGRDRVLSLVLTEVSETPVEGLYIVLNISEAALQKSVLTNIRSTGKQFFLINGRGETVFRLGDPEWEPELRKAPFLSAMQEDKAYGSFDYAAEMPYFVDYARMSVQKDWRLVQIQPKAELFRELRRIQWVTIIVTGSSILISLLVTHTLTRVMFRPMIQLQAVMKKVESNDLAVRYQSENQDEISQLGDRFNRMLERLGALIEEIRHTEAEKRKSDMKALQYQIDPHFLYNTLNTIYMNAELDETDNVKSMIRGLSQLFRLGLNNGREMTTLAKELAHVTEYVKLQQQCYEGLFTFSIEADESLYGLKVMKLMLQPLVENSILHGFREMQQGGEIRIEVAQDAMGLTLRVVDNGMGMNAAAVLHELHQETEGDGGYALRNVYNRLKLYYGERAGLTISSEPYIRTEVSLGIPLEGEEAE